MDIRRAPRFAFQDDRAATRSPSPEKSLHKRHTSTARFLDPSLSGLSSPTALEELEASRIPDQSTQNAFHRSINAAAPSEKSLAIRAASACRRLEEWLKELEQWHWPSSHSAFQAPDRQDPTHGSRQDLGNATWKEGSLENIEDESGVLREYWGSLTASTVLHYEKRIEEIGDAIEDLGLEEIKAHIRDVHLHTTSRPQSSASLRDLDAQLSDYNLLDAFTAIVTTIIMQALPVSLRVKASLGVWEVRLAVLRAVPGFKNTMGQAQEEMTAAWRTLGPCRDEQDRRTVTRSCVLGLKAGLESRIRDLGRRLDFMLDTLEGRQDTIPDIWLDDMEQLEADFGIWVVEADRLAVDWELRSPDEPPKAYDDPLENRLNAHSNAASEDGNGDRTITKKEQPAGYFTTATANAQTSDKPSSTSDLTSYSNNIPLYGSAMPKIVNGPPPNGQRPSPLNLSHRRNHSNALSDFSSDSSYPGSATSDYFSNMPSPEIQDASKTEYFGFGSPVEVATPRLPRRESRASEGTVTPQSSQRTERGDCPFSDIVSPSRSRVSTVIQEPTINEDLSPLTGVAKKDRPSLPNLAFEDEVLDADTQMLTALDHPAPTPPIPTKSRHRFEDFTDLSPGNTPVKVIRRKTADAVIVPTTPQSRSSRTQTASPAKSTEDELEARISSILTDIPANIRLARSSDTNTETNSQSPANQAPKLVKKVQTPRLMRSQTAIPSPPAMTLTLANQNHARAQNGELEIKLYHLRRSDSEAPIKLFVRLVGGGGERVMVRIGGGWADLAEYLKEYAIHHGRCIVKDGRFDIQGLPHSQSSSPITTIGSLTNNQTPKSRPNSPNAGRSGSGVAPRTRRFSADITSFPSTPRDAPGSPDGIRPISRDSNASSRRSCRGADSPSLGLAGPKSRKAAVSPNKQAWVDTMVEKARSGSSEKIKGTGNASEDLGIVGGTKRLFMKRKKET
ncbi:MAG: hypothetical protein LQ338_006348 [Usnochroma carphineum]|nr:MAG: hypothetical protein LQ338_006348 [Usnochroma carphineum]